jgi:hypothetical protein
VYVSYIDVTDVLEGTSTIDWLKKMIGCLKQVPGKRKSIDCLSQTYSLSLSLSSFYMIDVSLSRDIAFSSSKTKLIN